MVEYRGYYIKPYKGRYKVGTLEFDIMGTFPTIREAKNKIDKLEEENKEIWRLLTQK